MQLLWNRTDVFYYESTYIGRFSHFIFPANEPWGVDHEDDLQYLLELPNLGILLHESDPEFANVNRMTCLFVNFVKSG